MNTKEEKILYKDLSYAVVGSAMKVHGELGFGFLEKVYENALMLMLKKNDIEAQQQVPIDVLFNEEVVGQYYADILVDGKIILEIKAVDKIIGGHVAQVINYLKATKLKLGIILNFNKESLEYKRVVL
jgi:GxxExxY protein